MAQAYQLPGEFRAPDMSATAAYAGNQTLQDQEVMNNFIRQYDATTNITNANRMQSLRERQFAQEMINADRNFQLARDQQEYNFQAGTRDFDLKKEYQQAQLRNFDLNAQQAQWNLQMQREDYDNTQEAIKMAPSWRAELDGRLGPSGAYGPNAESIMAEFVLEKGTNLGAQKVLENMIGKLQQTAQNYQNNTLNKTIIDTRKAIATNQFGSMKFTDPNLDPEVGEVGANFILTQLQQARAQGRIDDVLLYQGILNQGLSDAAREKQARIQEEATIRASKFGLPVGQVDVKGGEVSTRFEQLKATTGTGAGGSRAGLSEKFAGKSEQEAMAGFKIDRDTAKGALDAADQSLKGIDKNSAEYAVAKENRDAAYNDYVIAKNIYENNARKLSAQPDVQTGNKAPTTETPSGTTAPAVVPSGAPAGSINPLDYLNKPKTETPSAPMSATTTDAADALLSPRAKRVGSIIQTAEMAGGTALEGLKRTVAGPVLPSAVGAVANLGLGIGEVAKDLGPALKELSDVRELRRKAQLAANTRADKGENPTVAYQEELQKLVSQYQSRNQPTISVR
jgi:hypothetical protein